MSSSTATRRITSMLVISLWKCKQLSIAVSLSLGTFYCSKVLTSGWYKNRTLPNGAMGLSNDRATEQLIKRAIFMTTVLRRSARYDTHIKINNGPYDDKDKNYTETINIILYHYNP